MAVTTNYGAAPTYVKIASQTLASAASSYTFSNVPQGYTDLVLITTSLSNGGAATKHSIRVNGDSGNNYSTTAIDGSGSAAESWRQSSYITNDLTNYGASTTNTTIPITSIANFMSYSNPVIRKTIISRFNSSYGEVTATVANWNSTSPITSITMTASGTSGSFASGSTFTLYGVKAALVPKASGGDIIVQDGTYWYHTFRNTGAFVPKQALTCDYLVVAGGGGGGADSAGGGGAGGVRCTVTATGGGGSLESALSLTAQVYPVTVGAGGAGGSVSGNPGTIGSNSVFSSITSTGGGRGGGRNTNNAGVGGSGGGGAGINSNAGAAGTSGQGYAGGTAATGGGGGGGAGAVGSNGSSGAGGNGGNGVTTSISGSSVTYAGGGGGGRGDASAGGASGGSGGGGQGGALNPGAVGANGATNLGGGGGGGGREFAPGSGGAGGSGLVIVRYPI